MANKTNKKLISFFSSFFILAVFLYYFLQFEAVEKIAKEYLDLNKGDLIFTPIFGAIFFGFFKLLEKVFIKDYIKLMERRESLTSDLSTNLSSIIAETKEIEDKINSEISQKHSSLFKSKEKIITEKKKELESKNIDNNKAFEIQLKKSREELNSEIKILTENIEVEAEKLSNNLIEKIVSPSDKVETLQ